jgi:hypothetical protein
MVDNDDRAEWASKALVLFSRITGLDPDEERQEAVGDLIANIGHYCDRNGLDFMELAAAAISLWDVEKREEDNGEPHAMYPPKSVRIIVSSNCS